MKQFEYDATTPRTDETSKKKPKPRQVSESSDYDSDSSTEDDDDVFDSLTQDIAEGVLKIAYYAVTTPGVYSWDRVQQSADPAEDSTVTPRALGDRVIPFVRLDVLYNRIDSDIYAHSERAEIGYGPFAFQTRAAHYKESNPSASLDIKQHHWLYRMSLGDSVELDLGLGGYEISGESTNSGSSSTIHLLVYPTEHLGVELRPSWATVNGNEISDHELDITYGDRYWSVLAGYHWLESPGSSLNGPFVGFSLRL